MLVIGAIMMVPTQLGTDFVTDNCARAKEKKFDEIKPPQATDYFKMFADFDESYKTSVNSNMCSQFCVCPGGLQDEHY